jgi:hypothetical protein
MSDMQNLKIATRLYLAKGKTAFAAAGHSDMLNDHGRESAALGSRPIKVMRHGK